MPAGEVCDKNGIICPLGKVRGSKGKLKLLRYCRATFWVSRAQGQAMPEITVLTAVGWLFWKLTELGYGHSRTQILSLSEEGTLHALWLSFLPGFHNGL